MDCGSYPQKAEEDYKGEEEMKFFLSRESAVTAMYLYLGLLMDYSLISESDVVDYSVEYDSLREEWFIACKGVNICER